MPDRIDYVMSTRAWSEFSNQINIGVHNTSPEEGPVDFSIRVRDFTPRDVYPEDVRQRSDIIDAAFASLDVVNKAWDERESRNLLGDRNFTYGEARFHSLYPLI